MIRSEFSKIVKSLPEEAIVVNQIPLLFESKGDYRFDYIITISAPQKIRIERLLKRGLSPTQIDQRIKAQASDVERESISDSVIVNDNDLTSLTKQVEDIWSKLTEINRLKK